jgi:Family of unknown function (DUF6880)
MKKNRKSKLIDLGVESLADALLELALQIDAVDDSIERLIAAPDRNVKRFKKKLKNLNNNQYFINRRESSGFASELSIMLQDLKAGITDPDQGVELVAAFYETDSATLGNCDDSNGCMGDIFRYEAKELFLEFASLCSNKEKVANILIKLITEDDYGVRDSLLSCAGQFLPELIIRNMIKSIQKLVDDEENKYKKHHYYIMVELLARQIKDAKLFEQTRIAFWGKLSTGAFIDIARVYLECGDVQTAYSWIGKIPENDRFLASERDQLLLEIYRQQNNNEKLIELLYHKFKSHHSENTLQDLLDVIGLDKKDEIVSKEVILILENPKFNETDVEFLILEGKINEAEKYILKSADQLNGNYYGSLLSIVESMESDNRNLATTLIYRSLLISILERRYSRAYHHGVHYLKKLDKLATCISEWKNFNNHEEFKEVIHKNHSRKHSFWSKYNTNK